MRRPKRTKRTTSNPVGLFSDVARALDQQARHQDRALALAAASTPAPAPPADVAPPLTKEQAMADTLRALKECYPDRWERVWAALAKESESDKAVAALGKIAAKDPRAVAGAILGGALGAALGKLR